MLDVLLWERSGKYVFYFEEPWLHHPAAGGPGKEAGRPSGRIWRTLDQAYHALESRLPLTERLCSQLRFHDQVKLHVPGHIPPDLAQKLFLSFLRKYVKRHRRWLIIDGVLAVLGTALVWLPGPNVFFFYPALRALGHYYAQAGGEKHWQEPPPLAKHCGLLDDFADLAAPQLVQKAGEIENQLGFTHLGKFLEKKYGNQ